MYSLILDSSTKVLYCALVKNGVVLEERYISGQNDHAKNIVLVIEELLKKYNLNPLELNKVISGVGPGSYTGVRMAVTVSKMLTSLSNVKLYEIRSLFLMASGFNNKVISMIDARRGNVFSSMYDNYEIVLKEDLRSKEEILKNSYDIVVNESEFKVNPLIVLKYATEVKNPHAFVPNYLRLVEAERNLNNAD